MLIHTKCFSNALIVAFVAEECGVNTYYLHVARLGGQSVVIQEALTTTLNLTLHPLVKAVELFNRTD